MEFTREEALEQARFGELKQNIFKFMKKAYAIVNDPSTDSMISWGPNGNSLIVKRPLPLEYTQTFLFRTRALSLERFVVFGFTKTVSGSQVEYANDDFVRGQPERLEKIGEPFLTNYKEGIESAREIENDRKRYYEEYTRLTSYRTVVKRFKDIYSMVDDPETNSFISWTPNGKSFIVLDPERCDCLPYDLLEECGFTKTVCGSQMEFASEYFVAGKPELLEKIGEKHKPAMMAYHKRFKEYMNDISRKFAKEEADYALKRALENTKYANYVWPTSSP